MPGAGLAASAARPNHSELTFCCGSMQVLHDAARQAGRQLKILRTSGAGSDHPLLQVYPEGQYLTAVTVQVV